MKIFQDAPSFRSSKTIANLYDDDFPDDITSASSLTLFRQTLKAHLFCQ